MKMEKKYHIRYNTESTDDSTSWRLICDGEETLVSNVKILTKTITTKNYIPELEKYKYHITCTGNMLIENNVAYITDELNERHDCMIHILKTISYRFFSSFLLVIISYLLGLSFDVSALLGFTNLFVKSVFYYIHERFWYKINVLLKK